MKVSYKVTAVTLSTEHVLMVRSDCYGNLLNYGFFRYFREKNYIGQMKHERGLYLRHIQRH